MCKRAKLWWRMV